MDSSSDVPMEDPEPPPEGAKKPKVSHKRNRMESDATDADTEEGTVRLGLPNVNALCSSTEEDCDSSRKQQSFCAKKARGEAIDVDAAEYVSANSNEEVEKAADVSGNQSDSDSYDDLEDDFDIPNDMDDYLDDGDYEDDEDTRSTTSTRTTMSTGSVGSNTPSLVGENLESFSLGEGGAESKAKGVTVGGPVVRNTEPPLKRSLFSHTPPSINFVHHNEVPETPLPAELRKNLRWKLSNITPAVVKKIVTNSGFRLMRKNCTEWGGTWGKHMKSSMFKDLSEAQKINHFPGTFNIGRKDRLWKNYQKLRLKFGKSEFSFLPRTFCLPADTRLLKKVWEKRGVKAKWIIKPPAMARGTGIKVVNKWNQIPKNSPLIVQRYIAKPHLINDTKYDLRIYVLMTSVNPLKIFLYDEGLVRFASNKYATNSSSLSDVYMHLTNYSINKNNSSYTPNEDPEVRQGHKWTLASLWQHFAEAGIDSKVVWERIKDMVIKTIVSAEHSMLPLVRGNFASRNCGYELFGFDVLLDSSLKPWLIEVNISPSLHSSSPLDLEVKSPLATEVFNIVRYHVPNKISAKAQKSILKKLNMEDVSQLCLDPRLYTFDLSKADKAKQNRICACAERRDDYLTKALDRLTPDDVRCLIRAEDEMAQLTRFQRIFPTQETHKYFKYFQQPRYYNLLLDAWEHAYGDCRPAGIDRLERLCQEKVHLKVPSAAAGSNAVAATAKRAAVDVSGLKAPTGNGPSAGKTEPGTDSQTELPSSPMPATTNEASSTPVTLEVDRLPSTDSSSADPSTQKKSSPPSRLGFVAKPLHLKPNVGGCSSKQRSKSSPNKPSSQAPSASPTQKPSDAATSTSQSSSPSSPEPMSLGGDWSAAPSDKSRTPSPVSSSGSSGQQHQPKTDNDLPAAPDTTAPTSTASTLDNRPLPGLVVDDCAATVENNRENLAQ